MLIITRRPGEKVMLGDDVVVEVIEVSGNSVRIGIAAPRSVPVYREEIGDFTANLRAPILIANGRGHQVINAAGDLPFKAPLFASLATEAA